MTIDLGMSKHAFQREFFEKKPLLVRNGWKGEDFGWGDLNDLVQSIEPRAPYLRLHRNGVVPDSEYVEEYTEIGSSRRILNKNRFYECLRSGATAVLHRAERRSHKLRRFCTHVSELVGAQTMANGYLAVGGDGTFGNHWDTHDVFVMQLIGSKPWKIFSPTIELPLARQTSRDHKASCPTTPVLEMTLNAGDVLYIPRGWWHNATPSAGIETFHVAIGIHPPMMGDYIRWLLDSRLSNHLACRYSLVNGALSNFDLTEAAAAVHRELTSKENLSEFLTEARLLDRGNGQMKIERGLRIEQGRFPPLKVQLSSALVSIKDENQLLAGGRSIQLEGLSIDIARYVLEARTTTTDEIYSMHADEAAVTAAIDALVEHDVVDVF